MVNKTGKNGVDNGIVPPDAVLAEALCRYAREKLTTQQRIERLRVELGYCIKRTKLQALQRKFRTPSVRRPYPPEIVEELVRDKVAQLNDRTKGPETIVRLLADEGNIISRSLVRSIMHKIDPEGAALRDHSGHFTGRMKKAYDASSCGPE
ncbi:hypothetical protein ONZ51_g6420 [Trametes cubensis]|uniref:Uncharacterized protein n=1 Tax=Trametes cubensis TaxID=1111947 RepID=A0AAD7XAK9_9APHY|nr:hypothetical protein ONZ51_g6420 [Trametes cubensis]